MALTHYYPLTFGKGRGSQFARGLSGGRRCHINQNTNGLQARGSDHKGKSGSPVDRKPGNVVQDARIQSGETSELG